MLAFIEGEEEVSKIGDVSLEGINAGFDSKSQIYTFVDGEFLTFFKSVENTMDLQNASDKITKEVSSKKD